MRKGGDIYATASIDNSNATAHKPHPSGDFGVMQGWANQAEIEGKINGSSGGDEIKSYYKSRWITLRDFLKTRQQWKNSNVVFQKGAEIKKSIALKGVLGSQNLKSTPASSIKCDLQKYNIWYLSGEIKDGKLSTNLNP